MIGGVLTTILAVNPPSWVELSAFGLSFLTAVVALGRSWNTDAKANTERITKLESAVSALKEKYQDMGDTINKIESTVSDLKLSQVSVEARLTNLEAKVDKLDNKMDCVIEAQQQTAIILARLDAR